jgi:hypothetical protein
MRTSSFLAQLSRWGAYILSGFIVAVFLVGFLSGITTDIFKTNTWTKLKPEEILMFVFLGIALVGLIIAFFKQLLGGIIAVVGSLAFVGYESMTSGSIMSFSDGIFFYILLFAGLIHIVAWFLKKSLSVDKSSVE